MTVGAVAVVGCDIGYQLVGEKEEMIINSSWDVFSGPIYDQDGKLRVPAGQEMSESELLEFNWLVEGIIGPIPAP